jgi:hypothetical protein
MSGVYSPIGELEQVLCQTALEVPLHSIRLDFSKDFLGEAEKCNQPPKSAMVYLLWTKLANWLGFRRTGQAKIGKLDHFQW